VEDIEGQLRIWQRRPLYNLNRARSYHTSLYVAGTEDMGVSLEPELRLALGCLRQKLMVSVMIQFLTLCQVAAQ
jgi:hypothetical protein